jgi:glycosyltransferase involved in cell wall biosynthesis
LKRAIQSVLDQTYPELECIVVDDASIDDTDQIINTFEDDRLKYFRHEKNKGTSAARNTGIRHSKGGLIAFLDDDDEWIATKLEKQVPLLKGLPERFGMVYCWMDYYDANNKLIHEHHPTLKGYVFPQVLDAQRLGGCPTLLVKRKVVDQIGGFDESLIRGNDGDFIRRICRKYEVDFLPEVLVKIHIDHGMPRISDDTKKSVQDVIKSLKIRFEKFSDDQENYPKEFASICLFIAYHYATIRELKESIFWSLKAVTFSPLSVFVYKRIIHLLMEAYNYSIK